MTRALSFPKSRRLTRSSDFERMKKEGRSQRGSSLILSVLPVQEPVLLARRGGSAGRIDRHALRAGFVTSKRVGSAVVRNRVRRRLREIVRKHQAGFSGNFWIVTIARPKAARATYRELEDEWLRLAKRASILAP